MMLLMKLICQLNATVAAATSTADVGVLYFEVVFIFKVLIKALIKMYTF